MKIFRTIPFLILTSCTIKAKPLEIIEVPPLDYPIDKKIEWADIITKQDNQYYVYFYSTNCGHCASIKRDIIYFSIRFEKPLYFCDVTEGAPTKSNPNMLIGVNDIVYFFITGTPFLVEIIDNTVTNYFSGVSAITVFINNK